jgi:hypothetical protein
LSFKKSLVELKGKVLIKHLFLKLNSGVYLEQILQFPIASSLFANEDPKVYLQDTLDKLASGKLEWGRFREESSDLSAYSRIFSTDLDRSLLHLAVLDNQIEVIKELISDTFMKQKRDKYGLNPLELSRFLHRKEAIGLLEPHGKSYFELSLPVPDDFEVLETPIFEDVSFLTEVLQKTACAKKEDEIPPEKIWMGIYFEKEIENGLHPPISIQYVGKNVGYGVFAEKTIAPCSFVGEYTGIVYEKKKKNLIGKKYCMRYPLWEGKKHFTMDAEKKGNFTRFINHSSNPNLGLQSVYWKGVPRMIFVALKEIKKGSQLTFDYGASFWKDLDQTPINLSDDI